MYGKIIFGTGIKNKKYQLEEQIIWKDFKSSSLVLFIANFKFSFKISCIYLFILGMSQIFRGAQICNSFDWANRFSFL